MKFIPILSEISDITVFRVYVNAIVTMRGNLRFSEDYRVNIWNIRWVEIDSECISTNRYNYAPVNLLADNARREDTRGLKALGTVVFENSTMRVCANDRTVRSIFY